MPTTPDDLWPAMVRVESKGDPNAIGKAGEIGLVQIKPSTAADYGVPAEALYHPEVQRMLFNRIMGKYLTRYGGNANKAVAAWNAGQGAVDRGATDPGYVRQVADALGSAASTIFGEGTAEAAEFPEPPAPEIVPWRGGGASAAAARARLGRPGGGVAEVEKGEGAMERALSERRNLYGETPRFGYGPSPRIPTGPYATYAHPMGATITKDVRPPAPTGFGAIGQKLRATTRRVLSYVPDLVKQQDLTNPSVFGPWVDMMTNALAQLPPGRFGTPKDTINLPLIRKRSEGRWEVPYGDPRSPMWKPTKGEPPMESALKASFEDALPMLVIAGGPFGMAVAAEGLGVANAVGASSIVTEFLWNGVGIPAVTSALSPVLDKATDHLADGIERTGAVNPEMAFPLANSLMNVFRMFPQLAFFPRDAANLARAMTQRELIPELADLGEWLTARSRGPWVNAIGRFLERQGYTSKFIPFTLAEALQHEREDQTRQVLERARTEEVESARRQRDYYEQLQRWSEQAEIPGPPTPVIGTPYGAEGERYAGPPPGPVEGIPEEEQ